MRGGEGARTTGEAVRMRWAALAGFAVLGLAACTGRARSVSRSSDVARSGRGRAGRADAGAGGARRGAAAGRTALHRVVLVPLGGALPALAVREAAQAIRAIYGFAVSLAPGRPLPSWAYYRPRRRYRAGKLLDYLRSLKLPGAFRVVGVTAVDISTTKGRHRDWGIMGLAPRPGRVCVVSLFRCRRGAKSAAQTAHRFAKTVVHELGHTLGLDHCPTRGCLMEDARGTNRTTDGEWDLCCRCRARLRGQGYRLPEATNLPWPHPKRWLCGGGRAVDAGGAED